MELLILGATLMPEEKLLEDLQESITEYKSIPSESNKKKMLTVCMMLVVKHETDSNMGKAMEMIKRQDTIRERNEMFEDRDN